jgi:hypothetical protein
MNDLLKVSEPELALRFTYTFNGRNTTQSATFFLADFDRTLILRSPIERGVEKLGDKLDKISDQLKRLHRSAEALSVLADGTGLRISERTLRSLREVPQLFDPKEFGAEGYRIIADISTNDAHKVHQILRYFPAERALQQYRALPEELRRKFERHFKVDLPEENK